MSRRLDAQLTEAQLRDGLEACLRFMRHDAASPSATLLAALEVLPAQALAPFDVELRQSAERGVKHSRALADLLNVALGPARIEPVDVAMQWALMLDALAPQVRKQALQAGADLAANTALRSFETDTIRFDALLQALRRLLNTVGATAPKRIDLSAVSGNAGAQMRFEWSSEGLQGPVCEALLAARRTSSTGPRVASLLFAPSLESIPSPPDDAQHLVGLMLHAVQRLGGQAIVEARQDSGSPAAILLLQISIPPLQRSL